MTDYRGNRDEEMRELYRTPANRRLKYWALASAGVAVLLMLAMIIWMDELSYKTMMFMRGCTGLLAIVFVTLCAILVYRVNKEYIGKKM